MSRVLSWWHFRLRPDVVCPVNEVARLRGAIILRAFERDRRVTEVKLRFAFYHHLNDECSRLHRRRRGGRRWWWRRWRLFGLRWRWRKELAQPERVLEPLRFAGEVAHSHFFDEDLVHFRGGRDVGDKRDRFSGAELFAQTFQPIACFLAGDYAS